MTGSTEVTRLLHDWRQGDNQSLEQMMPLVYAELRRIADRHLRRENPGHTLQPTALVHEAFMNLVDADVTWSDRMHFYAAAGLSKNHCRMCWRLHPNRHSKSLNSMKP